MLPTVWKADATSGWPGTRSITLRIRLVSGTTRNRPRRSASSRPCTRTCCAIPSASAWRKRPMRRMRIAAQARPPVENLYPGVYQCAPGDRRWLRRGVLRRGSVYIDKGVKRSREVEPHYPVKREGVVEKTSIHGHTVAYANTDRADGRVQTILPE